MMADSGWYWGVVIRVEGVDGVLATLDRLEHPEGVLPQRVGTGHITLLYAPLRTAEAEQTLADAARPVAAAVAPFRITVGGFGEFATPGRVVAWLGVEQGREHLDPLRVALCHCDIDVLEHPFVPHLTLVYGDRPDAYATVRSSIATVSTAVRVELPVTELWVAGFRRGAHPATDLVYRERLPLGARASSDGHAGGADGRRQGAHDDGSPEPLLEPSPAEPL